MTEEAKADKVAAASICNPDDEWVYHKPLQGVRIDVLRDYLSNEFNILRLPRYLPFDFDFERVIDDFVFMCFFVGNDFLPHLPSLDIRDGAIDYLMELYKQLLPSLGSYITSPGGIVNLRDVDVLLSRVGEIEDEIFKRRRAADEQEEGRRNQYRNNRNDRVSQSQAVVQHALNNGGIVSIKEDTVALKKQRLVDESSDSNAVRSVVTSAIIEEIAAPGENTETSHMAVVLPEVVKEEDEVSSVSTIVTIPAPASVVSKTDLERKVKEKQQQMIESHKKLIADEVKFHEQGWKERYYGNKFKKADIEQGGGLRKMCFTYIEGLCWVFQYYYVGCPSWNWYYPFHYAPFASDLVNVDNYKIKFEMSCPFKPTEQLLSVLPADSVHALPPACHPLMLDANSPIIDLYSSDVEIDPDGKHLPWLWVLLLGK